ncbi:uncharacterized protein CANTADRAFT_88156 [Suhomyces tanzawaensis NRRL Y-17324]|uniref:Glyoxylate reductase n=1 Tax=Suhomyces tanzawaensis NRRL Y-17324 TaxID=984487 RepID=A0A1E4SRW1_9ASCO|nr:uncharacterized protein CANTADRAFT_88156 [Suhomyces tanzawaensis NRRL Y-17324]ODV82235.1 hypothetical protein CANTADRAFT_88156 [Suhomyces tanzawaensis NRRL Y-17324]
MSSTTKPKVLRLGKVIYAHQKWEELEKVAEVITCTSKNRDEFFQDLKGKYSDVVSITRTFASVEQTGRFDEELVLHLPASVKTVSHCGAGYDQVDAEPLKQRGIQLSNVTVPVEAPTADTAIYLILAALRNFQIGHNHLVAGQWGKSPRPPIGRTPEGKTIGLLGMGGIGRAIRDRLKPFGFEKITYYNRSRLSEELEAGAVYTPLDQLLRESDIVVVGIPLNAKTKHSINKETFDKMKDDAILINIARGAIIDEKELIEALKQGKIGAFGADVFEHEPEVPKELYELPNVVSLPHMGTYAYEATKNMEEWVVQNVEEFLKTGKVKTIVPEQYDMEIKK